MDNSSTHRIVSCPSPSKATRSISFSMARPLQTRDLNSSDASREHASTFLGEAVAGLDTPPPSSPTRYEDDSANCKTHASHQRSSSVTLPYSSSPPRSAHSSPPPGSPVKTVRQSRPSLPLNPASVNKAGTGDPHAGLEEVIVPQDGCSHILYGSYTHALMLGRCKPTGEAHASAAAGSQHAPSQDEVEDAILGSKPTQHVFLPNSARHVSRRHAILEWLPFSSASGLQSNRPLVGGFVVRILGQNGLIVDGKRRREGHVLRLEPGRSTIDFFGVKARFEVSPQAHKPFSLLEAEATHRKVSPHNKRPRPSLPSDGSSPLKRPEPVRVSSLSGSSKSVAQLLSGNHAAYVKRSTLSKDSELPPSPPSSSPPPMVFTSQSRTGSDSIYLGSDDVPMLDDGIPEPASPTAGRGDRAVKQQLPTLHRADSPSPNTHRECAPRTQSLTTSVTDETSAHSSPAPRLQPRQQALVDTDDSDNESELTPSPTPSPRLKPQVVNKPPKAAQSSERPRDKAPLTNSQISMPPPRLPASASVSAQPATFSQRDAESLRDSLRDRARGCVARIAATYDLEGLLAGAIVFHRTATISASEAVRSVLAGTQGMMRGEVGSTLLAGATAEAEPLQHGSVVPGWGAEDLLVKRAGLTRSQAAERWSSVARRAWTEQLEIQLQSKAMFGQIQRAGKDASGNSLEHWYYYNKDGDEDADRAANLGALAKPIRGALKTHKPIFWKKSAYPRSADEEAEAYKNANESTAARVYATAWKDDREWDLFTDSQIPPAIVSTPTSSIVAARTTKAEQHGAARSSVGIDEKRIWEETQPEEREKTWDRVGDMDWSSSGRASPSAACQGPSKRKKRAATSQPREG